ncbi:MAG: 4Fe-4S dicluster domain-containing protein [Oscillospiraceae bacterium]|jgi:Na+-translocating ferredoxin:NAD+ oxidoreductase RNF subunit RnfB|nr:4Fe-4S dicluster domain-containing protein [Oscillospiraceae bacterium]
MAEVEKFFHSVRLDKSKCKGCINCLKRCPTQAIRVRKSKSDNMPRAVITKEFCIDCGECIRVCPHHAKLAIYDAISALSNFEYKVALVPPAFYAQFNNLEDTTIVLDALKSMGFDTVYEVSAAAEQISEMTRKYIKDNPDKLPLISSACPAIVRLIRIKFPNLLTHLSPFNAPVDLMAFQARSDVMEKTGLPSEKIGIAFISPCPAKVTALKYPLGIEKSDVNAIFAMKDIYPPMLTYMKLVASEKNISVPTAGRIGVGWGSSGGEAGGTLTDSYLSTDGIENVMKVLEALEDRKIGNLDFIELNACPGGCVGGVLTVENPYVAQAKLKKVAKYLPVAVAHTSGEYINNAFIEKPIEYKSVFSLGSNFMESLWMMGQVDELIKKFPSKDCGACGAPTCNALAEDIVRGKAKESDCVFINRENIINEEIF